MLWFLWTAGEFRPIVAHFNGSCVQVLGVVGAEDITIDVWGRTAYLSAYDRRAEAAGRPGRGGLYAYDLTMPVPQLRDLTPAAPPDFRPHGLSLLQDVRGQGRLFVVNHQGGKNSVEIYDVTPSGLVHRETIRDPALVSPNDVVAVGERRFYVTNDHGSRPGFLSTLEDYLRLPRSNVQYFDGTSFHQVAGDLRFANGINRSANGRQIYVAEMLGGTVDVYDRDPASGALTLAWRIPLDTGPDNIEVDELGRLWIGAHPKLLSLAQYANDPSRPSPAQVLRVDLHAVDGPSVKEIFLDPGERIAAASVAAERRGRLLIGPVWDGRFLDCRLAGAGAAAQPLSPPSP